MRKLFLGVDTSNYRTSAAIFDAESMTWQNSGRLLAVPKGQLGLRQSDAVFQHTLCLHEMIAALPAGCAGEIQAVCVSTRPRAVEGSYMPCFLAGENVARSIAHLLGVPLYTCSHQQGHLAAAALSADALALLQQSFLAWHLSGGTTELLYVTPGSDGMPNAEIIGGTTDIAAGQLIDRAGVLLGLQFPAGAALDLLATQADGVKPYRVKVQSSRFSLSGMQNKVEQLHASGAEAASVARFAIETVRYAVDQATEQALRQYPLPILCAGGVMSNSILRKNLHKRFNARFAAAELSGDNAVGAAVLAAKRNGALSWRSAAPIR